MHRSEVGEKRDLLEVRDRPKRKRQIKLGMDAGHNNWQVLDDEGAKR